MYFWSALNPHLWNKKNNIDKYPKDCEIESQESNGSHCSISDWAARRSWNLLELFSYSFSLVELFQRTHPPSWAFFWGDIRVVTLLVGDLTGLWDTRVVPGPVRQGCPSVYSCLEHASGLRHHQCFLPRSILWFTFHRDLQQLLSEKAFYRPGLSWASRLTLECQVA